MHWRGYLLHHTFQKYLIKSCSLRWHANFLYKPKPVLVGLMSITQSTCRLRLDPNCLPSWHSFSLGIGSRESAIPCIVWPTSRVVSGKGAADFPRECVRVSKLSIFVCQQRTGTGMGTEAKVWPMQFYNLWINNRSPQHPNLDRALILVSVCPTPSASGLGPPLSVCHNQTRNGNKREKRHKSQDACATSYFKAKRRSEIENPPYTILVSVFGQPAR